MKLKPIRRLIGETVFSVDEVRAKALKDLQAIEGLLVAEQYERVEEEYSNLAVDLLTYIATSLGHPLVPMPASEWSAIELVVCSEDSLTRSYEAVLPLWTTRGRTHRGLLVSFTHAADGPLRGVILNAAFVDPAEFLDPTEPGAPSSASDATFETNVRAVRPPPPGLRPVPERWRPQFAEIVHRLVIGDYDGLAADGFVKDGTEYTDEILRNGIEYYPDRLVDLPPEAWNYTDHAPYAFDPNLYSVIIHLWTEKHGQSDLSLDADVREVGGEVTIVINLVQVL